MGIYFSNPPALLKRATSNWLTWEMPAREKKIYLTFDDGPVPEITPQVLDILKSFDAKATFFCVGDNVRKYPELYADLKAGGHTTGNHTYNHLQAWKTPAGEYLRNVAACRPIIESRLFRPPHGQLSPWLIQQLRMNYQIILWSVLSGDFDKRISPEQCLQVALRHTKAGSIVVFHDSIKAGRNMLYAIPLFLEHFKARGYEFAVLDN